LIHFVDYSIIYLMENTQGPIPVPNIIKENPLPGLVKKFPKLDFKVLAPYIIAAVLVVLAGIGTGWLVSGGPQSLSGTQSAPGAKAGPNEAGLADEKTFRDSAEGVLEEGGVNGEGTHHLTRAGGTSQNVYLTSTVIDLQSFVGKKVTVWGETISAKKAGWLMDVGKVKVIE
jgi:hypothetical protein